MTVDTLELTDSFLQEAQAVMGCDPDIPMHYRILCKLNQENELDTAKRFLEANRALFQGRYAYLVPQSAVEMCLNLVADENGAVYRDSQTLPKEHIYRSAPAETEYIAYLLRNGADPRLPEQFDQYEHLADMEQDCSHQCGVRFDLSEIRALFDKYC